MQRLSSVISIFSAGIKNLNESIEVLMVQFGKPDFISTRMPFDYTDYYEREMGTIANQAIGPVLNCWSG